MVLSWIFYKLWSNLYQIDHNWIFEPSKLNKSLGISTIFLIIINSLASVVLNILELRGVISSDSIRHWIGSVTVGIYNTTYFLYLTTTLIYQRNQRKRIEEAVSQKSILILKVITSLYAVIYIGKKVFSYLFDHSQLLNLIYYITKLSSHILIQILVTCLYIAGLRNVANYYHPRMGANYQPHSDDRIHELLIVMTRCTVIVGFTTLICTAEILFSILSAAFNIDFDANGKRILSILICKQLLLSLFVTLDGLTIYFLYEFAHTDYLKLCRRCHSMTYNYCKKKYTLPGTSDNQPYL